MVFTCNFLWGKKRPWRLSAPAILKWINTNMVLSEYRENQRTTPPHSKNMLFSLSMGVCKGWQVCILRIWVLTLQNYVTVFMRICGSTKIFQDIISSTIWKMEVELTLKGWTKKALGSYWWMKLIHTDHNISFSVLFVSNRYFFYWWY